MKQICLLSLMLLMIMIIACSDSKQANNHQRDLDSNEDRQTLIATNERLVSQLEKERAEKERILDKLADIDNKNNELKDDILTYKQQAIDSGEHYRKELDLRNKLDQTARSFIQSMHEKDHSVLEELSSANLTVDRDSEVLKIKNEDGSERTFHYLKLNDVVYIRQKSFSLNDDDKTFKSEYEFYSDYDEDFLLEGGIEFMFENDNEWLVTSVRYIQ